VIRRKSSFIARKVPQHDALLFGTSLYDLKESQPPSSGDLIVKDGLRLFAIEPALTKVPEAFLPPSQSKLSGARQSREPSGLLRRLLDGETQLSPADWSAHFDVSGAPTSRKNSCRDGGRSYSVRESNPLFRSGNRQADSRRRTHRRRIQSMWESMRGTVLSTFPPPPGLPAIETRIFISWMRSIKAMPITRCRLRDIVSARSDRACSLRRLEGESNEAIKKVRCSAARDTGKRSNS